MLWVNGHLLHRPHKSPDEKEKEAEIFCNELDPNTLKVGIPRMYFTGTCAVYIHVYLASLTLTLHTAVQGCLPLLPAPRVRSDSAAIVRRALRVLAVLPAYSGQRHQPSVWGESQTVPSLHSPTAGIHVLGCWLCNCALNSCIMLSISTWCIKYMYICIHCSSKLFHHQLTLLLSLPPHSCPLAPTPSPSSLCETRCCFREALWRERRTLRL